MAIVKRVDRALPSGAQTHKKAIPVQGTQSRHPHIFNYARTIDNSQRKPEDDDEDEYDHDILQALLTSS